MSIEQAPPANTDKLDVSLEAYRKKKHSEEMAWWTNKDVSLITCSFKFLSTAVGLSFMDFMGSAGGFSLVQGPSGLLDCLREHQARGETSETSTAG